MASSDNNQYEGVLFGLGNPLLDISAKVDTSFLTKYDLKSNDAILADEKHTPIYQEVIDTYTTEYIAGGSSQNALRGAQSLLPPNSTVYTGCVGKDSFSDELRTAAAKDGLKVEYLADSDTPTGVCAILITGQDRLFIGNELLAANKFHSSHLEQPYVKSAIEKAKFFYVEGYFLTVSLDSILTLAKHAAETNKVFGMNLSAPFLPEFFGQQMNETAPYWDYIFGNETEAVAWAKSQGHETTDLHEIAILMANLPKVNVRRFRQVLITHGSESTILAVQGQRSVSQVRTFPVTPVPSSEIEDTNGAGDAFVGGFFSQLIQGKPVTDCINVGHYLAGQVIRLSGAQYPRNIDISKITSA
ncbi:adenosine kinase b [Syncephalis fuscata]|nr:adenosine kinase b [Syncephalis fuscata]